MATKKTSRTKTSSGSDPKSKAIVKKKVGETMHEFKKSKLKSGRSAKKVRDPKQAIAIGLSEARRSGADIPPDPNQPGKSSKKSRSAKKTASNKAATKSSPKKTATKASGAKKASRSKRQK